MNKKKLRMAINELGYAPIVSYRQSMDNCKIWYRRLHALDSEFTDMLRQLYS